MTFNRVLRFITINKCLLAFLVICGFFIILYVNSELLVRKSLFAFLLTSQNADTQAISNEMPEVLEEQQMHSSIFQRPFDFRLMQLRPLESYINGSLQSPVPAGNISDYNIFVIYTKENYQLHVKFELFTRSLLKHSSVGLHIHVITDENSKSAAEVVLQQQIQRFRRPLYYSFYNLSACSMQIMDIINAMKPYFSSTPKSYYSDALFFLSLGLHRIIDPRIERAVLLDCDLVFRSDIRLLFSEFERFSKEHLFGLAPELTPVYRHILYRYRANHPETSFGNPYYPMSWDRSKSHTAKQLKRNLHKVPHGYPGLNSGVVLLYLSRIRTSKLFLEQLVETQVQRLTTKYSFRGHLGDQDFFTLLGFEFPHMIYRLDCIWNRQLCTWWKDHGYSDIFNAYFHCEGRVQMYHGNCNTRVPE